MTVYEYFSNGHKFLLGQYPIVSFPFCSIYMYIIYVYNLSGSRTVDLMCPSQFIS